MRIAVIGVGGLGGYYGGLLARAGEDVTFIARGASLAALRARGLAVRSEFAGDFALPIQATDDPRQIGPADLVLFCVKTYDLESAAEVSRPLVGSGTVILPVQNGVDAPARLGELLGTNHALGGISYLAARRDAPGVIVQGGLSGPLLIGELAGGSSPRCERIRETFARAGALVETVSDVTAALWEKLVLVCGTGGVMALMRLPIGPILACPESRAFLRATLDEAEAVARANGVALTDGCAARHFATISQSKPWTRSSMLNDVLAGRRLEL
ncbi:MAG TPA: 2-dehydropantoate 2-reductase, partial [Chloroflexota bacterium]|nr:2-dehydropantoate 2-reductase [Chloroflexota bacterium]